MFDLEKLGGSFKGIITECMFKLANKKVVITKFFNKEKYFNIFGRCFNKEQEEFLRDNWYSIDGIEIQVSNGRRKLILYEVKTKNAYYADKEEWNSLKITANTHNMYLESKALGFEPYLALIWILKDWKFDVEIKEFESE